MIKFSQIARLLLLLTLMAAMPFSGYSQTVEVDGTSPYRKWDKIAVSLTLPSNVSESDTSFRNNRMDVIFTDSNGNNIRVPGYFAADGNAANTNATSGKIFKAYLRPNKTGNWTYQVLYYTGTDVALKNVNQLPNPTHNLTGTVGNVTVTNATLPDLRAKGRLEYQTTGTNNQRRYLRWAETGEHFLKFGPDSPENLLNYKDFDHDTNKNGCGNCTEHTFSPHASDWKSGNPTWDGQKGKNLIGVVNYLKNQQMNAMSMSLYGGDDRNVFPWTNDNSKFKYDVSKLEQWEIVFDYAEKNGLALHFKLAEDENWDKLTLDQIKVYYREMVARFGHHLAVEWNISEEYGGADDNGAAAPQNAIPRIDWLASIDPWQNHRVFHTYPDRHEKYYNYLIANNAKITGASVQSSTRDGYDDAYDGKSGIKTWINNSKNGGTPWVVASDEQNSGATGIFTSEDISNKNVKIEARTKILWKGLIAGGAGVMWYGGKNGDFRTENFNRFDTLFEWTKIAILQFFEGNGLEYWKMQNNDALASGNLNRCLAQVGKTYVIYLEKGGSSNLNLAGQSGNFNVKWFNPRNGGGLQNGSVTSISGGGNKSIGNPPNNTNSDWVALITQEGGANVAVTGVNITPPTVELEEGKTFTLVRAITPTNASDKTVSWTTSNANIATVNSNGIVTAVTEGQATITGTTQDGNFTDTSAITVTKAPVIETGCPFEEKNGLLIIEAESAENYDQASFILKTNAVGSTSPTGDGYLRYIGPEHHGSQVPEHTVAYKIKINNPGAYQFVWRNVRDPEQNSDDGNDSWLLIRDNGVKFYGKKGNTEYPLTKHTKIWIQESNFVFECYGETHEGGPKVNNMIMWADFPTAGEYTIEYGGRSAGHCVDRLILYKANQSTAAKNVNTPQSTQEGNCQPSGPDPDPDPNPGSTCDNVTLNAINFPTTQVNGFSPAYVDNTRKAMAINAAQHKDKFAAVAQNFAGNDGTYDITITTLAELDGESSYRVKVGGTLVGTYKNPTTTVDYTPTTKTWTGISVKKGDAIQVEFSSHTNGQIPEGNSTAYSRGRWTGLEFVCKGNTMPNPGTESVGLSNLPASFNENTTTFPIEVTYTANQQRDINVTIKSPADAHIADQTITVGTGTNKTATVNVTVPTPLAVASNYKIVVALRTVGGNFSTNIDKKVDKFNIDAAQNCEDKVSFTPPTSIPSSKTYSIDVTYTACQSRDIIVEFWQAKWIASGKVTVPAGSGTTTVTVNLSSAPALGSGYIWKTSIRPEGTDWKSNIDTDQVNNVTVTAASKTDNLLSNNKTTTLGLTVYPNPVGDKDITLQLSAGKGSASYIITDMNGRSVISGTSDKKIITIPSKALNQQGVYILKVNVDGQQLIKKIVK